MCTVKYMQLIYSNNILYCNEFNYLGVNFVLRNLAKTSTPVVEISKAGDEYTLKTTTTFKTSEIKFKLGQEFEEARMDGKKVKVINFFKKIILYLNMIYLIVFMSIRISNSYTWLPTLKKLKMSMNAAREIG